MGRLHKKKDPEKKKLKKQEGPEDVSMKSTGGAAGAVKQAAVVAKRPSAVTKAAVAKQESNFLNKSIQFLREVKIELKKVTWPNRKQTLGTTVVVIILVMIISLFLGLVDIGLSGLIRTVLGLQ